MSRTLKPWCVVTSLPGILKPADLDMDPWVRQCRIYGWAPSRAAFARMLVESGASLRNVTSMTNEIRDYGSDMNPESEIAALIPKPDGLRTVVYVDRLNGPIRKLLAISSGMVVEEVPA